MAVDKVLAKLWQYINVIVSKEVRQYFNGSMTLFEVMSQNVISIIANFVQKLDAGMHLDKIQYN